MPPSEQRAIDGLTQGAWFLFAVVVVWFASATPKKVGVALTIECIVPLFLNSAHKIERQAFKRNYGCCKSATEVDFTKGIS